ncbi:phospholipase/carboxylesterase [Camillea tinctor]|nr:phospholipase/carboxylesterase [Camillea tinctor]
MDQLPHLSLATYVVEPIPAHRYTLILLHGLGSNGEKFGKELLETGKASVGRTLAQLLPGAHFVFPTAKWRRSSAFRRSLLTQWFDIAPILRQELAEVASPQNLILGWLSQGCGMSLSLLLALEGPLAGFIGMCGYLPFQRDVENAIKNDAIGIDEDDPFAVAKDQVPEPPAVRAQIFERDLLRLHPFPDLAVDKTARVTPVFLGHGELDQKKPYVLAEAAARTLQAADYDVTWKLYPSLGHWYRIPDEINDIVEFIRTNVGWELVDQE